MSQQTAGVAWSVTDGTRVPFEIYTSQDVFDREQDYATAWAVFSARRES